MNSDEASMKPTSTLSSSILEAWTSLPTEVRAALVSMESGGKDSAESATASLTSENTSENSSSSSSDAGENTNSGNEEGFVEICPNTGSKVVLKPLERAPNNVFEFSKTNTKEKTIVEKTPAAVVTTKTSIMTRTKGWRNVFTLPIAYDVNMIPCGTLLDPSNPQMLDATGNHPEGYNRRFAVLDNVVNEIYGDKIRNYFKANGIELTTCVLNGGEADKRPAVSWKIYFSCVWTQLFTFFIFSFLFFSPPY